MNTTLTNREKKLIALLIAVAFVLIPLQYLVKPQFNEYQKLSQENESLNSAFMLVNNRGGIKDRINNEYEENLKKLNDITGSLVSRMLSDEELSQYFTDLSLKHGLKPKYLNIEYPNPANKPQYEFIKTVDVTITVGGGYESLISVVDEIDGLGYLKILNMKTQSSDSELECTLKIQIVMLAGE